MTIMISILDFLKLSTNYLMIIVIILIFVQFFLRRENDSFLCIWFQLSSIL